jgi:hypothetical protein
MNILKCKKGEGYIDTVIIVLVAMVVIALALKVFPVFIAKNQLNTYVNELARTAEIEGYIGSVTQNKAHELTENLGINPTIQWSKSGRIQLNESFSVTGELKVDIGFFEFGAFPITLRAKVTGRSEVYYK